MDDIINGITGYETSKDYEMLWDLSQKQSIVCISDYHGFTGEVICRDVCHTISNSKTVNISCRGVEYVTGFDKEHFIKSCESQNIEWIIPCKTSKTK